MIHKYEQTAEDQQKCEETKQIQNVPQNSKYYPQKIQGGYSTYETRKNFWKLKYDGWNLKINGPPHSNGVRNDAINLETQAKKISTTQNNKQKKTQEIKEKI